MFSYSKALELMKEGKLMQRSGWNGKGMFIYLMDRKPETGSIISVEKIQEMQSIPDNVKKYHVENNIKMEFLPYIMMFTADQKLVPWLCSQTDMVAEDWIEFSS